MPRRIPWLILGVVLGLFIGGCIREPRGYYHNGDEYAFHMQGYLYGMWVGLIAGVMVDLTVACFRQEKNDSNDFYRREPVLANSDRSRILVETSF